MPHNEHHVEVLGVPIPRWAFILSEALLGLALLGDGISRLVSIRGIAEMIGGGFLTLDAVKRTTNRANARS